MTDTRLRDIKDRRNRVHTVDVAASTKRLIEDSDDEEMPVNFFTDPPPESRVCRAATPMPRGSVERI